MSRAFDRVWRAGLYSKMIPMGMPTCIVQWVYGFLSDRRTRVRFDDTNSRSFPRKPELHKAASCRRYCS
ncbi:reverse transcriptase [Aphelenchoides avenae]|nr:reverse transcriptase [Aphelenchus avenae]